MLQDQNTAKLKNKGFHVFPASGGENLFPAEREGKGTCLEKKNLFDTPPSDTDISTSASHKEPPQPSRLALTNPFHRAPTKAADLLSNDSPLKDDLFIRPDVKDIFASPVNAGNPFSSPSVFTKDFTNGDPFDSPLPKQDNDFQRSSNEAPDIFHPLPLKSDLFETPRGSASSTLPHSTSSLKVSPDLTMGTTWSSPGFLEEDQFSTPTTTELLSEKPEVVLTTPQGTKKNILQPTPFTRARNLRVSSSRSPPVMTHVCICNSIKGLK